MWSLIAQLGLLAISLAASYYLQRSIGGSKKSVELSLPRAEEGDAIPLAYGRVRISSPIVVSMPDGSVRYNETSTQIHYYTMLRMVLCLGNHRVGETAGGAQFISMLVGDKELPNPFTISGPGAPGIPGYPNLTGSETYFLAHDSILGTGPAGPIGTSGVLIFYSGRWDQERHSNDRWSPNSISELPAYRGQVVVTLAGSDPDDPLNRYEGEGGGYYSSWYFGDTPNLPAYSFIIENRVTIPGYEDLTGPIGIGGANPAAVIWDLLTHKFGRVGNDPALLDIDSFVDCATTLRDEEHGISIVFQQAQDAKEIIETILRQIDGVLYEDPITRQYTLRLIREDYDVVDLPVVDPSVVTVSPVKPGSLWSGTVNVVRVNWLDATRGFRPAVASATDEANVAAQGGYQRPREFSFPGVTDAGLANFLANRELNFLSRPLERLEVTVNRSLFDLRPGDAFLFSWPEWDGYENVFRVMDLDRGTLEDGTIKITAVQDRFFFPANVFDPEDEVGPTTYRPSPIIDRIITEAPRWVQLKSWEAGDLANVEAQHGYYLAGPEGYDSRYRVDAEIDGAPLAADSPARPFPGTFEVDLAYDSRTKAGYDTATGLRIRAVVGWTPTAATNTEIATLGRNLIQVGGEILAFEGVTDLGGGDYLLTNVWPAVLDTRPSLHAVGEPGYVLPGPQALGALGSGVFRHGSTIETLTAASAGSNWTPAEVNPADTIVARSRNLLPYPPAKLLVAGSATPAAIGDDEGVTLDWRDRLRTKGTITRQNASDETPGEGTTYAAVGYKDGGAQVVLEDPWSDHALKVALGKVGHGAIEVGVDSRRTATLPSGDVEILTAWQVPTLELLAHHYRNLLLNSRFAEAATVGWTWTIGTPDTATTNALGGAGSYLVAAAAVPVLDGYQTRSIAGYTPRDLRAILRFAANKNPGGGGTDTVTVYLYSLDASGSILDTQTYGPSSPATWAWQTLEIANLDPDTASIRVRVVFTGGGARATCGLTECHLYVGQISSQLLVNPSFETGPGSGSWTAPVGTWQGLTATPYGSPSYLRPNDGASAQLHQDPAIAAGYEGGVAVLVCGRMNDAADDTGQVTLQALGAADAVIATVATAAEAITPTNAWVRRWLALELPADTLKVRVKLDAARVTGTPLNSCFDDFDLRIHKHLDPDQQIAVTFDAGATQRLPSTRYQWLRDFPTVTPPNHALYAGGYVGQLGPEPLLEATGSDATAQATVVVDQGLPSEVLTTACYELAARGASSIQVAPVATSFANFTSGQDWGVLVFFRANEATWGGEADIASRRVAGIGWSIGISGGGFPTVTLTGASGTITATGAAVVTGGDLQAIAVRYDHTAEAIEIVDVLGDSSASTAAIGQMASSDVGRMTLFGAGAYDDNFAGQIARLYLWRGTVPSVADFQSAITCATTPAEYLHNGDGRTGSIACVVGVDAAGVLVETFGPGRVAVGYDLVSEQRSLVTMPAVVNLAPTSFAVGWNPSNGATVTARDMVSPDGYRTAARISSTNLQGYLLEPLTLGAAGTRYLQWFARADVPHTARVSLTNDSGTLIENRDFAVTAEWQVFTYAFSWDGSTAGLAKLLFRGSSTGSVGVIHLSPLMSFSTAAAWTGHIAIGSPGATVPSLNVSALTEQVNREGELSIELVTTGAGSFVVGRLGNGTNDNDARSIKWDGGDVIGGHCNGSGTEVQATIAPTGIDPAETAWFAKLRWNRAGLVDGTASEWSALHVEQGVVAGSGEMATGRTATWTASTTPVSVLDVGHGGGADVMPGLVRSVRISAREPKV